MLLLTHPLQLINVPIDMASRHRNPEILAAIVQPPNFPAQAIDISAIVYTHVIPLLSKLKSVDKPEVAKYWAYVTCKFQYSTDKRVWLLKGGR